MDILDPRINGIPKFILVMGVSGSGKSTIGKALANMLSATFIEGDDYHCVENIKKMTAGIALTDDDRWSWMKAISEAAIREQRRQDSVVVIACSALKKAYREYLQSHLGPIYIIHLTGSKELIQARIQARQSHFMPLELLVSQLATLEQLDPEEAGISVSIGDTQDVILSHVLQSIEHMKKTCTTRFTGNTV